MLPLGMRYLLLFASCVWGLCYAPDGSLSNDVPCNPNEEASVCCTAGFLCMANGLCQPVEFQAQQPNQFIRGTCTDKDWTAPQCYGYCVRENPAGGEWVMQCSNATSTKGATFCCADEDCCNTGATILTLGNATVTATAGVAAQSTSIPASTDASTPSSNVSAPSANTSAPATIVDAPQKDTSLAVKLGIGIGCGVAGVAIIATFFLWRCFRKRTANKSAPVQDYKEESIPEEVQDFGWPQAPAELKGESHRYQLHSDERVAELPGHGV